MDTHYPYQHPQQQQQYQQHPLAHHPYAYAHAYPSYDDNSRSTSNNSSHSNLSSAHSSKQTSPVPSITLNHTEHDSTADMNDDNNNNEIDAQDTQDPKAHKGKLFQCTGFGDCRMVFTRSEHLARHARKHTGEKPFKCVVDGCSRMFSRFDNMVQHTQTHTKSGDAALNDLIAQKIAIETRRKSEAGTAALTRRLSVKIATGTKRGSISSASGAEAPRRKSRHERVQSLPMLNSWYASKLHHRPSLDFGLDQRQQFAQGDNHGDVNYDGGTQAHMSAASLPPIQYPFLPNFNNNNNSSSYSQARHPMSPAYSSHSDEVDSDDAGVLIKTEQFVPSHPLAPIHPLDHYKIEPLDDCTLPPLRTTLFLPEAQTRLPSITQQSRYRSHSIGFNATNYVSEPYPTFKTRRLSLVDLNTPIQQANKTANLHQPQVPVDQRVNGVDVSEDELRALEAFGELWSQGRDVEMSEGNRSLTPRANTESGPGPYPSTHAPGPDVGRRTMYPVMNLP
ncbi:hypothetical protein BGX29_006553 [Mortierella sp. GBA35]|nr:hypothetical protein BGX29_006553 [Mortierella sp. GBA35]